MFFHFDFRWYLAIPLRANNRPSNCVFIIRYFQINIVFIDCSQFVLSIILTLTCEIKR
jgi:hypothetical protein